MLADPDNRIAKHIVRDMRLVGGSRQQDCQTYRETKMGMGFFSSKHFAAEFQKERGCHTEREREGEGEGEGGREREGERERERENIDSCCLLIPNVPVTGCTREF
jgi:hypothetical protein